MNTTPTVEVLAEYPTYAIVRACGATFRVPAHSTIDPLNGFDDWVDGPPALVAAGLARRITYPNRYNHREWVATPALFAAMRAAARAARRGQA